MIYSAPGGTIGMKLAGIDQFDSLDKNRIQGKRNMPGHQTVTGSAPFDDLAKSLKAHSSKSQILMEVRAAGCTLEKVLAILEGLNINPVQYQVLLKGDPSCILLFLPNEDVRETVFRLTEAGFTRVKGVNPRSKARPKRN